jgi:hypothetical protein
MDISGSHVSVPEFLPIKILYIYITMFIGECSMFSDPMPPKTIQQKLALNAVNLKPMKSPIFLRSNVNSHNFFQIQSHQKTHPNKPPWISPGDHEELGFAQRAHEALGQGLAKLPQALALQVGLRDDDGLGKYPMAIDIQ